MVRVVRVVCVDLMSHGKGTRTLSIAAGQVEQERIPGMSRGNLGKSKAKSSAQNRLILFRWPTSSATDASYQEVGSPPPLSDVQHQLKDNGLDA